MSMYWAAYHGQGLVLTEDEFEIFLASYKEKGHDKASLEALKEIEEEDGCLPVDEVEFRSPSGTKFSLFKADDSSVEGFRLIPYRVSGKPNDDWDENENIPQNNVYVLPADKSIEGMRCFEEKAYDSYEEFVSEFKNKLEAFLPEDFDWDAHIGIYSYACYA